MTIIIIAAFDGHEYTNRNDCFSCINFILLCLATCTMDMRLCYEHDVHPSVRLSLS